MRAAIRVKPGSTREFVGGRAALPGDAGDALIVAVRARATDGQANAAALRLLARALDVSPGDVRLVAGRTARTKVVEMPDACARRWRTLLDTD
ncbi:MAG: DUF167 domain-containing protein [Actinomycetia bacterium]|nr:DUF167 domain-containing protein [Actinomycetes bacterium]